MGDHQGQEFFNYLSPGLCQVLGAYFIEMAKFKVLFLNFYSEDIFGKTQGIRHCLLCNDFFFYLNSILHEGVKFCPVPLISLE